jgi:predicted methyltransferase
MRLHHILTPFAILAVAAAPFAMPDAAHGQTNEAALQAAIQSSTRSAKFVARDPARHPLAELGFFGVWPDATVVEIWPGGGYWTEILAPYLKQQGRLYEALETGGQEEVKSAETFKAKLAADPSVFGAVKTSSLGPSDTDIAPAGSADFVLTFRNVHNWMGQGYAAQAFAAFYKALKPGGILGVEEHRGDATKPQDAKAENGYVRQDYTIALAKEAGFRLVGSSEIDANPKDTKDWPEGVWTLPPSFALGAKDHDKYAAIGEADNFVLKFQK